MPHAEPAKNAAGIKGRYTKNAATRLSWNKERQVHRSRVGADVKGVAVDGRGLVFFGGAEEQATFVLMEAYKIRSD